MKQSTKDTCHKVAENVLCFPFFFASEIEGFWYRRRTRKAAIAERRSKRTYYHYDCGWKDVASTPLPPRPERKGSMLSLGGGFPGPPCLDSPSPSTLLKLHRKQEIKKPKKEVSDQSGCFMLSRLPYEIRMMIYREVLGGHMFHIFVKVEVWKGKNEEGRRMGHIICPGCVCSCCVYDPTSIDRWDVDTKAWRYGRECECRKRWDRGGVMKLYHNEETARLVEESSKRGIFIPFMSTLGGEKMNEGENEKKEEKENSNDRGLLSLLKTCRQVYSEAIPTLYSANTFEFPHHGAILAFKATIPPQRQAAIRSIQVRYTYTSTCTGTYRYTYILEPPGKNFWWNVIAGDSDYGENDSSMTSLKQIRIMIPEDCEFYSYEGAGSIFKPMGDLVNAVAKARSDGRDAISVVMDYPLRLDRNQEKLAEVLERAPFLKVRTPRCLDIPV